MVSLSLSRSVFYDARGMSWNRHLNMKIHSREGEEFEMLILS